MGEQSEALGEGTLCTEVAHFYTSAARDMISRFCQAFLDSAVITPSELLHSSKYQKKLNDSGPVLRNVIDKVASLQATEASISPVARIKQLQTLISSLVRKSWEEDKAAPPPAFKPAGFGAAVAALPTENRDYHIARMLTEHLVQHRVWADKIAALIGLLESSKGKDEAQIVAVFLGECLRSEAAIDALLGPCNAIEPRLHEIIDLWKGQWKTQPDAHPAAADLNRLIAEGALPSAKDGIELSLLRLLANTKVALRSEQAEPEMQALCKLSQAMRIDARHLIGDNKTLAIFERRMSRILTNESVADLLAEKRTMADKAMTLLALYAMTIGQASRAILRKFIEHYFDGTDFEVKLMAGNDGPMQKLAMVVALHKSVQRCPLPAMDKSHLAERLEWVQGEFIKKMKLYEQIAKSAGGPSHRVMTLIDMCRKGLFTEPKNRANANNVITKYLRDPDFLPGYLGGAEGEAKDKKVIVLTKTLGSLGIVYPPSGGM